MKRSLLLAVSALLLATCPAMAATTYYVGFCHTGSFATISEAVNTPNVAAGSIIKLCPQNYTEQVIVNKSLTIEGMTSGNTNLAVIFGSKTGATVNSAISGTTLSPVIWVQSGTLNLSNVYLYISTTNESNCTIAYPGIYFAGGSSGTINHIYEVTALSNETCAIGVWAENTSSTSVESSVTIENSWISTDYFGIVAESQQASQLAPVLRLNITDDQITVKEFGVYLQGTGGTVNSNTINITGGAQGVQYGIQDVAPSTIVSRNTINTQTPGIIIGAANTTVTGNKLFGSTLLGFGATIDMGCFTGNVTGNTLLGSSGIIHVPNGYTGKNTVYGSLYILDGQKGASGC